MVVVGVVVGVGVGVGVGGGGACGIDTCSKNATQTLQWLAMQWGFASRTNMETCGARGASANAENAMSASLVTSTMVARGHLRQICLTAQRTEWSACWTLFSMERDTDCRHPAGPGARALALSPTAAEAPPAAASASSLWDTASTMPWVVFRLACTHFLPGEGGGRETVRLGGVVARHPHGLVL